VDDIAFVFFTCAAAAFDCTRFNPTLFCEFEPASVRFITHYDRNRGVRNSAVVNGIAERKHV